MTVDKIIESLEKFDDNVCCCYDGCPVYRAEFQSCPDGEEECLCFRAAIKALRKLQYIEET